MRGSKMKEITELEDFWSIKINTRKYGELYFSRITENLSEIFSKVKKAPEQLIEILMDASFYSERNKTVLKEDFDITLITFEEKEHFLQEFLPLQFEGYKIVPDISDYANFEKALDYWNIKEKERHKKIIESIQKSQINLTNALGANTFEKMSQLYLRPIQSIQEKIYESVKPLNSVLQSIEEATKIPSISYYTENYYSNLSNALKGINTSYGPLIAKINEPIKSLREQMLEASKALSFPIEQYKSAMDLIPDYYSISKIYRNESDEIDIYVKNTKKENAFEYNLRNAEADKGFLQFLHNITNEEAMEFLEHLQEFPYLALVNDTGKKIFEAVQTQICNSVKKENNNILFRARARKETDREWTKKEIGITQYGIPGMGRYNFIGYPVFYLTTDIETAKKEVESDEYPLSTVMKLNQIKEMSVFDISTDDSPLVSYCNNRKDENNNYTSYLIPNFLSVCCSYLNSKKRHSVDAIKYKSNKNENGICYVILDQSPLEFFDKGKIIFSEKK